MENILTQFDFLLALLWELSTDLQPPWECILLTVLICSTAPLSLNQRGWWTDLCEVYLCGPTSQVLQTCPDTLEKNRIYSLGRTSDGLGATVACGPSISHFWNKHGRFPLYASVFHVLIGGLAALSGTWCRREFPLMFLSLNLLYLPRMTDFICNSVSVWVGVPADFTCRVEWRRERYESGRNWFHPGQKGLFAVSRLQSLTYSTLNILDTLPSIACIFLKNILLTA